MVSAQDLVGRLRSYHPNADAALIERAFSFAEKAHNGQMRKSGDPYFVHPTNVAAIITELKLDAASVCAGLLHDCVEDTLATVDDLEREFGEEVAFLVDGVTKLSKINFISREDRQAENFRKMVVAMARDIRVLLVKLCDRLDNMRSLEFMKAEAQDRIARETMEIYAPLANRLGIARVKSELEDLSFKYLDPEHYEGLLEKVKKSASERERYITDVSKLLSTKLAKQGFAVDVTGRAKHLYSIWRKMQSQQSDFEGVYDVIAFRCVVESVADCYACLGVIHSQWTPVPGRFKDYVALPKPNMYQSLHTTVLGPGGERIEVQIRTHEMHRVAEQGIAAHWKYKERSGGIEQRDAERFAWLRQLMEWQKELEDPTEFLESVKVDLFPEDVYVFTPKGDVKTFPRDATPIDFAYSIHSEVGEHCTGARVNGVIVPLRHKLRNGDVVEILTGKNQQPSKDWLDFVVTGRARSRIRAHFRTKERARSLKLGRDLLERALHKKDLSFARWVKTGEISKTLQHFGLQNEEELFAQIGYGKIDVSKVLEVAYPSEPDTRKTLAPSFFEKTVRKVTRKDGDASIRIDGLDDVLVRFAKCCTPVPGDPVVGWITRGRGVTIHRKNCPRSMELDPQRRIDVSWSSDTKMELPVSLKVTTNNSPGILAKVSSVFTENGLNISEAICRTQDDGRAVNLFQFTVDDLNRLRTVMRGIAKITGVQDVERV